MAAQISGTAMMGSVSVSVSGVYHIAFWLCGFITFTIGFMPHCCGPPEVAVNQRAKPAVLMTRLAQIPCGIAWSRSVIFCSQLIRCALEGQSFEVNRSLPLAMSESYARSQERFGR